MLHIILLILKIIGIILLVILGLLLTIVLLVLLVPVRYQLKGSYYGELKGRTKITWLLHILSVTAAYDGEPSIVIRLFGFRILKPSRAEEEDMLVQAMEVLPPEGEQAGKIIAKEPINKELANGKSINEQATNKEPTIKESAKEETINKEPIKEDSTRHKSAEDKTEQNKSSSAQSDNKIFTWLTSIVNKIKSILLKLKFSFQNICDRLRTINEKKEEIQLWIADKENQKTIKLMIRQVKKLVRAIAPRKGKGTLTFGFDDPYLTGQILTGASLIYPFVHKHLDLYPVFDRQVLEGEGWFKGRIRFGTLVIIGGRLLLNRNFRVLLKKWMG